MTAWPASDAPCRFPAEPSRRQSQPHRAVANIARGPCLGDRACTWRLADPRRNQPPALAHLLLRRSRPALFIGRTPLNHPLAPAWQLPLASFPARSRLSSSASNQRAVSTARQQARFRQKPRSPCSAGAWRRAVRANARHSSKSLVELERAAVGSGRSVSRCGPLLRTRTVSCDRGRRAVSAPRRRDPRSGRPATRFLLETAIQKRTGVEFWPFRVPLAAPLPPLT